jgi:acetyl esterase/lipase
MNTEGSDVAKWLNAQKIHAFVLEYRAPDNQQGALQDLQRAISLVRSKAMNWNVDPYKVGVIGFSAGGHMAERASTLQDTRSYTVVDEVDKQSCRPDFDILVYPAEFSTPGARPRTLLVHSLDDTRHAPGTKLYDDFLSQQGTDVQMLIYPTGGHGYGMNSKGDDAKWLHERLSK